MSDRLTDEQVNNIAVWAAWDLMPTVNEARSLAREVQELRAEVERLGNIVAAIDKLHQPAGRVRLPWYDWEARQWGPDRGHARCTCGLNDCPTYRLLHPEEGER